MSTRLIVAASSPLCELVDGNSCQPPPLLFPDSACGSCDRARHLFRRLAISGNVSEKVVLVLVVGGDNRGTDWVDATAF